MHDDIEHNLRSIRDQIGRAALLAGRSPNDITLVGVSKTVPVERISAAIDLGLCDLGENRVQEAMDKIHALQARQLRWHFIGSLQSNKVKYILPVVHMIHSLDRWSLAQELERRAAKLDIPVKCLVEVNIAGEESKAGLSPAHVQDFVQTVAKDCPHIRIEGLMTVAPYVSNPEEVRPYMRQMKSLFDVLSRESSGYAMRQLSMGMSGDFAVAIEEGATIVRVGTAIFGRRE